MNHPECNTTVKHLGDDADDTRRFEVTFWEYEHPSNTMTVPFQQGSAWTTEPTAEEVFECLFSDAAGFESAQGFEDWAAEYGYDPDSRAAAEATYRKVEELTVKLREFCGADYERFLWADVS